MSKIMIDEATVKLLLGVLAYKDTWRSSISEAKEKAITALQEALAQEPAQQEPFGYFKAETFGWADCAETDEGAVALYERPPAQRTWVGLSEEEIEGFYGGEAGNFIRAIEAKLRSKNT